MKKKKRKDKRIVIWATQEIIDQIAEKMKQAGMKNRSAFMLHMALHGYIFNMDMTDVHEILMLTSRMSANMNQYAKKANETGCIYLEDIRDIKERQKEIVRMLAKILKTYEVIVTA